VQFGQWNDLRQAYQPSLRGMVVLSFVTAGVSTAVLAHCDLSTGYDLVVVLVTSLIVADFRWRLWKRRHPPLPPLELAELHWREERERNARWN
jgi:hypothetical protein